MPFWSRIANVFTRDRLNRDIDEELASHIEEALEQGRDLAEVRTAFGSPLRLREASRDLRVSAWLDTLYADAVFASRQLRKRKVASAAAILSLALAIGACISVFRLVDALLFRPLPVASPERLYVVVHRGIDFDGVAQTGDGWMYPMFRQMRAAVAKQAAALAVSYASRLDLAFEAEPEKAYVQYVSGGMFRSFGLRPALGRLLAENDSLPVAVLSYNYWTNRFGRDRNVLGRTFLLENVLYTVVGVAGKSFTGIEPGTIASVFVPLTTSPQLKRSDTNWFRILVQLNPSTNPEPVRERLQAAYRSFRLNQLKSLPGFPERTREGIVNQKVLLESAAAGISDLQQEYREPLLILAVLVALVLLIACVNVANLTAAQTAARAREMALRVSIGAGRSRLVQLVLVESALLAVMASAAGAVLAWWSAPFVAGRINPPDDPARFLLPADWRVLAFSFALTLAVALLFGLAPALRASNIKPAGALKGGEYPRSRTRLMCALIGAQVAFCFLVLFVAVLFAGTLNRLAHRPTGFSAARILTLETVTRSPQSPVYWDQVVQRLRTVPGVETAAVARWPLMTNAAGGYISVHGGRPFTDPAFFLDISPGWMNAMGIPFIAGRDFRAGDLDSKAAIVNEAFVTRFFHGEPALGKSFTTARGGDKPVRVEIVGLVRNARYIDLRGPMPPVVYFPFSSAGANGAPRPRDSGAFIVRTAGSNPLGLASTLRREVSLARPEFRVTAVRTQEEIDSVLTLRERLLALLGLFFAGVALLLAGLGIYGVLNYSVVQRRREIGIRVAVGARPAHIVRLITLEISISVFMGAFTGAGLGIAAARYIESLLYQVRPTDPEALVLPSLALLAAAFLAGMPALIHSLRIDPVKVLRAE